MTRYEVKGTKSTPYMFFQDGRLEIRGISITDNSIQLFDPLMKIVKDYCMMPYEETVINFHLDFLNSGTMRRIINLLLLFNQLHNKGHKIIVNWYYTHEIEDILDAGNIIRSLLEMPVNLVLDVLDPVSQ